MHVFGSDEKIKRVMDVKCGIIVIQRDSFSSNQASIYHVLLSVHYGSLSGYPRETCIRIDWRKSYFKYSQYRADTFATFLFRCSRLYQAYPPLLPNVISSMVNIFKLVKENNVDQIREYTQATSTGIATRPFYNSSQDRPQQQQQPNNTKQQHHKVQRQVNLNKRSIRGRTVLHCAASWNRIAITRLLLDCPWVNINIQDRENGWTALHR